MQRIIKFLGAFTVALIMFSFLASAEEATLATSLASPGATLSATPTPTPTPPPVVGPAAYLRGIQKINEARTDIPNEQVVSNGELAITAPKGWSYQITEAETPIHSFQNHQERGEILFTPIKEIQKSPVYLSLHDAVPSAISAEKIFKEHADDLSKLAIENWLGMKWEVVEYVKKTNRGYIRNFYAVTHFANKDYYFIGATPTIDDSQYQPLFMKIMSSVQDVSKK